MKELIYENQLKDTRDKLYNWVRLLRSSFPDTYNITEYMLQEANRIQAKLEQ